MTDAVSGDDRVFCICEEVNGDGPGCRVHDPMRADELTPAEREAVARDTRIRHLQAEARQQLNAAKEKRA